MINKDRNQPDKDITGQDDQDESIVDSTMIGHDKDKSQETGREWDSEAIEELDDIDVEEDLDDSDIKDDSSPTVMPT